MKLAYFDCQFGAAGDMLLAALVEAGKLEESLSSHLKNIALPEDTFKLSLEKVNRAGVTATLLQVLTSHEKISSKANEEHKHGHGHEHEEERNLADILKIIECSNITNGAKNLASRIFKRLALAESKVHGLEPEEIHFHEIGAIDSIVDILGFAIVYDHLEIDTAIVSSVPLGSGTIKTQHGIYPVPAPAVVELLKDANCPINSIHIPFECLTPTGAAILCEVASSWDTNETIDKIIGSGYGAGLKNPSQWPNICRIIIGSQTDINLKQEKICILETNIDDQNPQYLAYAMNKLLEAGALDVSITAATMKKGRSGHVLTVLCKPEQVTAMESLILSETSSIGLRKIVATRAIAERKYLEFTISSGRNLRVKVASDLQGKILNVQAEFEDLQNEAKLSGRPLKEIQLELLNCFSVYQKNVSMK